MKNLNLAEMLENVRTKTPLVHNITNYVTVNDCANILLACGGSPIMSDDADDVEDITSICGGLNINIGTLNAHTIPSGDAISMNLNSMDMNPNTALVGVPSGAFMVGGTAW